MSYTNPNGWSAPKTNSGEPPSVPTHGNNGMGTGVAWIPADGIANTDMDRIETNIKGLHTLLCQSGSVAVTVNNPYFSAAVSSNWNWTRINNVVFLAIREMASPANTANNELQIVPDTVWPDEILPESDTIVPCIFIKDQNDTHTARPGYFIMPSVNNAPIVCYITEYSGLNQIDGCMVAGNEGAPVVVGFSSEEGAGANKAIPEQTVFWMTDRSPVVATTTTAGP